MGTYILLYFVYQIDTKFIHFLPEEVYFVCFFIYFIDVLFDLYKENRMSILYKILLQISFIMWILFIHRYINFSDNFCHMIEITSLIILFTVYKLRIQLIGAFRFFHRIGYGRSLKYLFMNHSLYIWILILILLLVTLVTYSNLFLKL